MKTYQEVIATMVENEAFKIAQEGSSISIFYPGIDMLCFIFDIAQSQVIRDIKAGLTPEALKLGKQTYKNVQRQLRG
jgi:hypothetical protein